MCDSVVVLLDMRKDSLVFLQRQDRKQIVIFSRSVTDSDKLDILFKDEGGSLTTPTTCKSVQDLIYTVSSVLTAAWPNHQLYVRDFQLGLTYLINCVDLVTDFINAIDGKNCNFGPSQSACGFSWH